MTLHDMIRHGMAIIHADCGAVCCPCIRAPPRVLCVLLLCSCCYLFLRCELEQHETREITGDTAGPRHLGEIEERVASEEIDEEGGKEIEKTYRRRRREKHTHTHAAEEMGWVGLVWFWRRGVGMGHDGRGLKGDGMGWDGVHGMIWHRDRIMGRDVM